MSAPRFSSDSLRFVRALKRNNREEAGVTDWRVEYYLGHAVSKDLRVVYRKPRDLTQQLQDDAERIRTWLGDGPTPSIRVVGA